MTTERVSLLRHNAPKELVFAFANFPLLVSKLCAPLPLAILAGAQLSETSEFMCLAVERLRFASTEKSTSPKDDKQ
jgi:hypothetical protein